MYSRHRQRFEQQEATVTSVCSCGHRLTAATKAQARSLGRLHIDAEARRRNAERMRRARSHA